jgi:hypothetical protein
MEQPQPREAVMLACDLLVDDAAGDATLDLAMRSPKELTEDEAAVLLRRMLAEWRIDAPGRHRSAEIVAVDVSQRLLNGTLTPEIGGHRLLGALCYGVDSARTDRVIRLLDRLDGDLMGRADDALRADLEALARDVLRTYAQP